VRSTSMNRVLNPWLCRYHPNYSTMATQ
jgi:hypothetical protein